ncbi:MAG: DUF4129 domain-containing protein [Sphingobacteriales bacterium]|nr:DUF4129 domain-containing protein [Sphingobacteriales bacterium]
MFKKQFLYSFSILLLFFLLFVQLSAQTVDTVTTETVDPDNEITDDGTGAFTDSSNSIQQGFVYTIRNIPADSLAAIRKEKAYAYMSNLDSLLRERNKELLKEIEKRKKTTVSAPRSFFSFDFIKVLLWILAIAALLYLIYTIFLGNTAIFRTNRKNIDTSFEQTEEEEHQIISLQKAKAVASANYRLAVRYAYLELLELLNNKKYIETRTDKTNYQYVTELSRQPWANTFASVTLKYEYIWYGEYDIDKNLYQQVDSEFEGLKQKIR